jgi:hypothetical protein
MPSRRQYLGAVAAGVTLALPGCASPFSSTPRLDLAVENYRGGSVRLGVAVLRPDARDRSEAIVYEETATIPAESVGPDEWRVSDVAPVQSYRIEVRLDGGAETAHYHYVPDCTATDAAYEPVVHLVVNGEPGMSFQQSECRGDG